MQRNILLCVAGLTPQIITETLYALTQQRGERVDEIRVITTLPGQDKLLKSLLDPQEGKFFAFCRDYGIDPKSIRFDRTSISAVQTSDGKTLDDIRLNEENNRTADRICEIVRELAKDDNARIHASAAGGRKTMGIFLANAMQLFGRRQDALSHVLVNEPFENHPEFYYPTPESQLLNYKTREGEIKQASTAEARIELADIPFVRLRGVLKDWLAELPNSYGEIVERAQTELDLQDAAHDLRLNCSRKKVALLNHRASLSEREFFVYLHFARARKEQLGENGFFSVAELSYDSLNQTFQALSRACGKERDIEDHGFLFKETALSKIITLVKKGDFYKLQEEVLNEVFSRIKNKLSRAGLPERCAIVPSGKYGAKKYGLNIAPERIHWS